MAGRPPSPPPGSKNELDSEADSDEELPFPFPIPFLPPPPFLFPPPRNLEAAQDDDSDDDSKSPGPSLPPFLERMRMLHHLTALHDKVKKDSASDDTKSTAKDNKNQSNPSTPNLDHQTPPVLPTPFPASLLFHAMMQDKLKKDSSSDSESANKDQPNPSSAHHESPPHLPIPIPAPLLFHAMMQKMADAETTKASGESSSNQDASATEAAANDSQSNASSPSSPPMAQFLQRMMLLAALNKMKEDISSASDSADKSKPSDNKNEDSTATSDRAKSNDNTESNDSPPSSSFLQHMMLLSALHKLREGLDSDEGSSQDDEDKPSAAPSNKSNDSPPLPPVLKRMLLLSALHELMGKKSSDEEEEPHEASNVPNDNLENSAKNETPFMPLFPPFSASPNVKSTDNKDNEGKPSNNALRHMGPYEKFICLNDYENGESVFRALLALKLFRSEDLKTVVSSEENHKANLLHHAAKHGWVIIIDMLIENHGFDPMSLDTLKQTAVHYAAKFKEFEAFKRLVENHHCDPMHKNSKNETPLCVATEAGSIEIVKYYKATPQLSCDGNTCYGDKPLGILAAEHGHLDILKYLTVECNFNANNNHSTGTALDCATRSGQLDIVKYLTSECKCNPNGQASRYSSAKRPIHYASEKGHINIVRYLVSECKCDFSATAQVNYNTCLSPLQYATISGHFELVEYFVLELKCDAKTALCNAAEHGHFSILKLLAAKCDNSSKYTACLESAIEKKHIRIVIYLLALWEHDVANPLFAAAKNHNFERVQFLINECHVDPTLRDSSGRTALHYATEDIYSESGLRVVQCLLATGRANPLTRDNNGDTPLSIAGKSRNRKAIMPFFDTFAKTKASYPVDSYVNVLILGNSGAGKTTLSKVIERTANGAFAFGKFRDIDDKEVKCLTAGIVPTKLEHRLLRNIILHDFAGQSEYYASHTAVIENLLQGSAAVIVIVVDASVNEYLTHLKQWLTVIRNETQKAINGCKVIVVASHIESLSDKDKAAILERMKISELMNDKDNIECLDCRKLGGVGLDSFFIKLQNACSYIRGKDRRCLTLYCHMMYNLLQESEKEVLTLQDIASDAIDKGARFFLPLHNGKEILDTLSSLHSTGLIYYLNCEDEDREVWTSDATHVKVAHCRIWVVKNKQIFLKNVNGVLFAPQTFEEHCNIAQHGVIPVSSLTKHFPDYDPFMLVSFLENMGLCHVVSPFFLLHTNLMKKGQDIGIQDMLCLFFPSLVDIERPSDIVDNFKPQFGWYLQCKEQHEFFPQRFFHSLLLHLTSKYSVKQTSCSITNKAYHCIFWRNGIKWSDSGVNALIELVDENQCLLLLMSCRENAMVKVEKMIPLRRNLIKDIMTYRRKFCSTTKVEAFVVDPNALQYPIDKPKEKVVYHVKDFRNQKRDDFIHPTSPPLQPEKQVFEILPDEPDYDQLSIFGKDIKVSMINDYTIA